MLKCTWFCEMAKLHFLSLDFEFIVSQSVPYLGASWKITVVAMPKSSVVPRQTEGSWDMHTASMSQKNFWLLALCWSWQLLYSYPGCSVFGLVQFTQHFQPFSHVMNVVYPPRPVVGASENCVLAWCGKSVSSAALQQNLHLPLKVDWSQPQLHAGSKHWWYEKCHDKPGILLQPQNTWGPWVLSTVCIVEWGPNTNPLSHPSFSRL